MLTQEAPPFLLPSLYWGASVLSFTTVGCIWRAELSLGVSITWPVGGELWELSEVLELSEDVSLSSGEK